MKEFPANDIKLSLVIAAEKWDEELKATITSVFAQDMEDMELLIAVSSADGFWPYEEELDALKEVALKELAAEGGETTEDDLKKERKGILEGPYLHILECGASEDSLAAAFNRGLEDISGSYFMTLPAGIRLTPGILRELYRIARAQELDILIGGFRQETGETGGIRRLPAERICTDTESFLNTEFAGCFGEGLIGAYGNKLYKSRLMKDEGLRYTEGLCEKGEAVFALRFLKHSASCGDEKYVVAEGRALHETADPEALFPVLGAYNELFNSFDVDDDVINGMNNRMLSLFIGELKLVYASGELNDTEKLCVLTGLTRKKELLELLSDTSARGTENIGFKFMLRHGMQNGLHKLLLSVRKREGLKLRKGYGEAEIPGEDGEAPKSRKQDIKAQETEPEKKEELETAILEQKEAEQDVEKLKDPGPEGLRQEDPGQKEPEQKEGELSDADLEAIKKHLEEDIRA